MYYMWNLLALLFLNKLFTPVNDGDIERHIFQFDIIYKIFCGPRGARNDSCGGFGEWKMITIY